MREAFCERVVSLAELALKQGSFPNGALVANGERLISESISQAEQIVDPTAHAEMAVVRDACRLEESSVLKGCTLYTSLEPCLMCFHGAYWAGIRDIVYCCDRSRVDARCFEGTLSSVEHAFKKTHEPVSLYFYDRFVKRVIEAHADYFR